MSAVNNSAQLFTLAKKSISLINKECRLIFLNCSEQGCCTDVRSHYWTVGERLNQLKYQSFSTAFLRRRKRE